MSYDRRTLLKYMAGTSAAGMLAGCGTNNSGNGDSTPSGNGNGSGNGGDTVTTLEDQSEPTDDGEEGTQTPACNYQLVEPDEDAATALLWHARTSGGTDLLEETKNLFNGEYEHTLTLSQIPNSNFQVKLQSAIPSGEGPHMFQWAHNLSGNYWDSGFLSDQSDNLTVDPCQYTENAWEAAQWDDKVIGLPWAAETIALIYNKDIVDSPPSSFDEWTSMMEEYHDPSSSQFGLGFPIDPYYASGFLQAYGEEIYNGQDDELGVNTEEVKNGARLVIDELKPYMPQDPGSGPQRAVFVNGNAPFHLNGPWELPNLREADFDFGVTKVPAPEGATFRPYTGYKLFFFAKKMDNESGPAGAARDFAEWYTTNERRILNLANNGGFVPVHDKLATHPNLPSGTKGYAEQLADGYVMPKRPKMDQVWTPVTNALTQAFNGSSTVDEAFATAEEEIRNAWADS